MIIEILRCYDCGRLALAVDDERITSHKCSGRWDVELEETYEPAAVRDARLAALKEAEGVLRASAMHDAANAIAALAKEGT